MLSIFFIHLKIQIKIKYKREIELIILIIKRYHFNKSKCLNFFNFKLLSFFSPPICLSALNILSILIYRAKNIRKGNYKTSQCTHTHLYFRFLTIAPLNAIKNSNKRGEIFVTIFARRKFNLKL